MMITARYQTDALTGEARRAPTYSIAYAPTTHAAGMKKMKYRGFQLMRVSSKAHSAPTDITRHHIATASSRRVAMSHAPRIASATTGTLRYAVNETRTGVGLPVLFQPVMSG